MENINVKDYDVSVDVVNTDRNTSLFLSCREKSSQVKGRRFKKPSQVMPNQTYTIRELLERAVVGSDVAVQRKVYYEDDSVTNEQLFDLTGVDINTLDLVELMEMKSAVDDRISFYEQVKKNPPAPSEPKEEM